MKETKEIHALLNLIDDPDEEVFYTVSERIESFGKSIIPNLESLWENTPDSEVQERIEMIIHRVHFRDLTEEFKSWAKKDEPDLFQGALLVSKYQYPELNELLIYHEFERIRRNIWLELNNFLTPAEEVNVFYNILYKYYKLNGKENIDYKDTEAFLLNKVIETKRGNSITNGILYLTLCDELEIPVKAIHIPRQFLLAYFNDDMGKEYNNKERIQFFIDPLNGKIHNHQEVENYLQRIQTHAYEKYYSPMSNCECIRLLLKEFSQCFDGINNEYKKTDLLLLLDLLND